MNRLRLRQIVALVCNVLFLSFGIARIPDVLERARVPFDAVESNGSVIIMTIVNEAAAGNLHEGDRIVRMNGVDVRLSETLEHLADLCRIDDSSTVEYERGGVPSSDAIRLTPFYDSPRFALVMAFVGFSICAIAAFIAWQSQGTLPAILLHWSLLGLGLSILMTQGYVDPRTWSGLLSRAVLLFSYMLSTAGFFLFTVSYPTFRLPYSKIVIPGVMVTAVAAAGLTFQSFAALVQEPSAEAIWRFQFRYDLFHMLQALLVGGMVIGLVSSFRRARSADDRRRVQWVIWGLIAGPLPFVLLIIIPNIVLSKDLIPEDLAVVFLLITPFSLAVSLLRQQLFDIEILIRRSIVYGMLTVFVGAVYALSVLLAASLIGGELPFGEYFVAVMVSMGIALAFNPMRRRLQAVVDRTLFPIRTDYRNAVRRTTHDLHAALSTEEMCGVLGRAIAAQLPAAGVEVFVKEVAHFVLRSSVGESSGVMIIEQPEGDTIPLQTEPGAIRGLVRIRYRDPQERLSIDEGEYLQTVCSEAAMALDRLELQRSMIIEIEERRRLEELNALKSYFVSSVSHELRTPLTSIRMFAEMLSKGSVKHPRKRREYLEIIDHESERLGRMIDNVLDFSRIERGVKEYRWGEVDIVEMVRRAVSAMAYPFVVSSARLKIRGPKRLPTMRGDADALQAALINLLSNALKYSGTVKNVRLSYGKERGRIFLRVADRGFGIGEEELKHIFERFYRVKTERTSQVGGMGLGLSIVRHVIDAHGGDIEVQSAVGKGSTFTIYLPLSANNGRAYETNADR